MTETTKTVSTGVERFRVFFALLSGTEVQVGEGMTLEVKDSRPAMIAVL